MRAKRLAPYLFVLPSLLGLLAFFYVPFLWSARFLFLGQDGGALASFQRTLQNEMFLSGSGNTMLFCLCCVPPLLLLSTGLATGLRYAQRSARGFLGLLFLPYVLPVSAVVAVFSYLFDYRGPVNRLLATLGGARVQWLDSGAIVLVVVLLYLWRNTGFALVFLSARLSVLPKELLEAAQLDGAGYWRCCRHLLLPYLLPALTFVGVMAFVQAQDVFREVYLLSGSYPPPQAYTLQPFLFNRFHAGDFASVTAAAYLFTPVVFLCGAIFARGTKT